MPQNRTAPIEALLGLLRQDCAENPRRVHFIEYVLFDGLNDSDQDAERLPRLLEGVRARVNLIPHNPFARSPLRPPPNERLLSFQKILAASGVRCLIRWPRGQDIAAACGQLALSRNTLPPN
jgi:23S rRNA (adenine2503-C2)-methyltransferase